MGDFINNILLWLTDLGYFGIALGLMIEVIPSEIVLAYGGYIVSKGTVSFVGAVIAGTIGGTIAQLFLYWMGYYGGRAFLDKYGKYIFIHKKHIDMAEQWFDKYGTAVIFTARFIPVVRHAISIPAGIAKMSAIKFTFYTVLAIIPWSILFIYLGLQLGSRWKDIHTVASTYTQPITITAIVVIIVYFLLKIFKKRKTINS
jgi:membrane protein DedA with SNARE-associated domain